MSAIAFCLKPVAAAICLALLTLCGCWKFTSSSSIQSGGYSFNYEGEQAERAAEGEIPADATQIEVRNQFGDVRILPGADRMGWSWELTCWADTAEQARQFAELITLTVEEDGGSVQCRLDLPKPPVPELLGVKSHLTLHVPEGVAVDVNNSFGETLIEGVRGGAVAQTSFGVLRAQSVSGTCRLTNEHGNVLASNIDGEVHATTSFGKIETKDVTGAIIAKNEHGAITVSSAQQDVQAETSFSPINVNSVAGKLHARNEHGAINGQQIGGDVDAQTSFDKVTFDAPSANVLCRNEHGAIRLTLRSESLARVEAETSFGPLEVRVAAPVSPRIEAHTEFGEVASDYPVLQIQSGVDNFKDLDASVPRMTLRNQHGAIRVVNEAGR